MAVSRQTRKPESLRNNSEMLLGHEHWKTGPNVQGLSTSNHIETRKRVLIPLKIGILPASEPYD